MRLNEADAFQLEILLIHFYGRVDKKTGCLHNCTDGGDGMVGVCSYWKGKKRGPQSKEHKEKLRLSKEGMFSGQKNPFYGKTHSIETKKLISKNNGRPNAKVNSEQVLEIRRIYRETKITQQALADQFGLALSTTNQILTKRWWKSIN